MKMVLLENKTVQSEKTVRILLNGFDDNTYKVLMFYKENVLQLCLNEQFLVIYTIFFSKEIEYNP